MNLLKRTETLIEPGSRRLEGKISFFDSADRKNALAAELDKKHNGEHP